MIQEVSKSPKIALCRKCHGTGYYRRIATDATLLLSSVPSVRVLAGLQ